MAGQTFGINGRPIGWLWTLQSRTRRGRRASVSASTSANVGRSKTRSRGTREAGAQAAAARAKIAAASGAHLLTLVLFRRPVYPRLSLAQFDARWSTWAEVFADDHEVLA